MPIRDSHRKEIQGYMCEYLTSTRMINDAMARLGEIDAYDKGQESDVRDVIETCAENARMAVEEMD